jgi:4-hydroxy-tetrahydrodipicolinate synthase
MCSACLFIAWHSDALQLGSSRTTSGSPSSSSRYLKIKWHSYAKREHNSKGRKWKTGSEMSGPPRQALTGTAILVKGLMAMLSANRRAFLKLTSTGAIGLALSGGGTVAARNSGSKPLRGIFPIAQTPFTEDDKLDLDSLIKELHFIDRGGVHGFVWPQLASEWQMLTDSERLEGAEAVASTGRNLRPAVLIGVQGPNVSMAVKYAKHAERAGADAIISLPPDGERDPQAILEYYKVVGGATTLPLFVQAAGSLGVETILQMYRAIPTLRYVKDEAGQPLMRISALRKGSNDQLKIFSGSHGKTLIDEMIRGFSGDMPAASFADIYASAWDLWHAGKTNEAVEMYGNAAILINEVSTYDEGMKYILYLRGVFKTYSLRDRAPAKGLPSVGGGLRNGTPLDETGKQVLRELLNLMKPYLRA